MIKILRAPLAKARYLKRTGTPGHYKYFYEMPKGRTHLQEVVAKLVPLTKEEVYGLRVTTPAETAHEDPKEFGDYWRFVGSRGQLLHAIESNTAYVKERPDAHVIIIKGRKKDLEITNKDLRVNEGEMSFRAKDLFNEFNQAKVVYKGPVRREITKAVKLADYPAGHQLGMKVPAGGSSCASCYFYKNKDGRHNCAEKRFQAWNKRENAAKEPWIIPTAKAEEYCCDLFQAREPLEKAQHFLRPRAAKARITRPAEHEKSPWRAHREYEERAIRVVSDRLLALFLEIRRKWLHLPGEFHKAAGEELFRLNGRIFISPKTGKPLTVKQWNEVVRSLGEAVARIFRDQPDALVRRALLLGKVLQGMAYEARTEANLADLRPERKIPDDEAWWRALTFGQQHVGELLVDLSSQARKDISSTILGAIQNRRTPRQLEIDLFDRFAELNRDWRRIAETEIADAVTSGMLLSEEETRREGETIFMIGISAPDACAECLARINRKVVVLVPDSVPSGYVKVDGVEYEAIWPGKTNIGRSAGSYWSTIPLHPHCRCSWTRYYPEMKELLGLSKSITSIADLRAGVRKEQPIMVDLAKIFTGRGSRRPDSDFDTTELGVGAYVEGEHTRNFEVAKMIAKDHLTERKDYYKQDLFKEERLRALAEEG